MQVLHNSVVPPDTHLRNEALLLILILVNLGILIVDVRGFAQTRARARDEPRLRPGQGRA